MTTPMPSHGDPHEVPLDDTAVLPMYPASPAPARRKAWPWLIASAAIVGLCCGGAVIYAVANDSHTAQPSAGSTTPGNRFVDDDASPTPTVAEPVASAPPAAGSTAKPTTAGPKVSAKPTATRANSPRPAPTTTRPKPPPMPVPTLASAPARRRTPQATARTAGASIRSTPGTATRTATAWCANGGNAYMIDAVDGGKRRPHQRTCPTTTCRR